MATRATKIVTSLRDDPAAKAWQLVQEAVEDDGAYDEAIEIFERARITTPTGLKLKQKLLRMRRADLSSGDKLTLSGKMRMEALTRTIDEGISYLARRER
jgi:enoyl-CoA hydratase/carnithine racemase